MYNSIVHDHLCDKWLPTFETLKFFRLLGYHKFPRTNLKRNSYPFPLNWEMKNSVHPVKSGDPFLICRLSFMEILIIYAVLPMYVHGRYDVTDTSVWLISLSYVRYIITDYRRTSSLIKLFIFIFGQIFI